MSKKKVQQPKEEVNYGPQVAEGENVFGVVHIYASFNDTFVVCKYSCVSSSGVQAGCVRMCTFLSVALCVCVFVVRISVFPVSFFACVFVSPMP